MKKYFISFSFLVNGQVSQGNMETSYYKKIEGMEDIKNISRSIERDLCISQDSVVIQNFILMKPSVKRVIMHYINNTKVVIKAITNLLLNRKNKYDLKEYE